MAGQEMSPLQRGRRKLLQHHDHLVKIGAFKGQWLSAYVHRLMCAKADAHMPEDTTHLDAWHPKANGIDWIVKQLGPDEDRANIRRKVVDALNYMAGLGLISVSNRYRDIRFEAVDRDSKSVIELEQNAKWHRELAEQRPKPSAPEPRQRRTVAIRQTDVADDEVA